MQLTSLRKDNLRVEVFASREEMGKAAAKDAASMFARIIETKGSAAAVFAAAPSQNEFLESLLEEPVDWTRVDAFHMDEYIGLPPDAPQAFGNFLRRAIFGRKPFRSVAYIARPGLTPEAARDAYAALLRDNPPDIVFLGIGENGHLAFNDPAEADFFEGDAVKIVNLDDTCRQQQVNDGCFARLADVPRQAITLTIPTLMRAPGMLCVVPGAAKARALREAVHGPITTGCPASILRLRENMTVYTDRAGGALLGEEGTFA